MTKDGSSEPKKFYQKSGLNDFGIKVKPEPGEKSVLLDCQSEWPVIPTTCGKLVTTEDGKSVLDMTVVGSPPPAQKSLRTILRNLKCPVLNKEITFKDDDSGAFEDVSEHEAIQTKFERKKAVTDPYVAHPQNATDVLVVLDHMLRRNKLDLSKICEEEIHNFLLFLQYNFNGMQLSEKHKQIIKRLRFHKTLEGQFVSLVGQHSSCALIPSNIPTQQLDELQKKAGCLFLSSDALPELEKLYRVLGVKAGGDVTQFYVEYVFAHFSMLTAGNQMHHLTFIRDEVHPNFAKGDTIEKRKFLKCMKETFCIPDKDGNLHLAREFFNQRMKVFEAMFYNEKNKFPPEPFKNKSWFDLLGDIGLQKKITPQLFLQFCTTVAENARRDPRNQQSQMQSNELVKCLLSKLKSEKSEFCSQVFLSKVSDVEFIAPASLEEQLFSIHEPYQCSKNGYPPFIKFNNSVPWHYGFTS